MVDGFGFPRLYRELRSYAPNGVIWIGGFGFLRFHQRIRSYAPNGTGGIWDWNPKVTPWPNKLRSCRRAPSEAKLKEKPIMSYTFKRVRIHAVCLTKERFNLIRPGEM